MRRFKKQISKFSKIDYFVRSIYYSVRDLHKSDTISRNSTLKDLYKGRRCFIIGNAVSLNWIDLDQLKNEITFGLNALSRHKDFPSLENHNHFVLDPFKGLVKVGNANPNIVDRVITSSEQIHNYKVEQMYTFSPHPDILLRNIKKKMHRNTNLFLHPSSENYVLSNNMFDKDKTYYLKGGMPMLQATNQCHDLTKSITFAEGSLFGAIAAAIYLGCKEIYLVGVGYAVEPSIEFHFYGSPLISKNYFSKVEANKLINQIASLRNVQVYNILETELYYEPVYIIDNKNYQKHQLINNYAKSFGVDMYCVTPEGFESPVYTKVSMDILTG